MIDYYDLELNILSCLLQKPELMKQLKLEDKHFKKYQKIWQFMKSFYIKFGTFDIVLMANLCKEKFELIKYIKYLLDVEPSPSNFNLYQEQLISLYNQKKEEKEVIKYIYSLTNDLYIGNINLEDFLLKISTKMQTILK